jgi:hypothetical protein
MLFFLHNILETMVSMQNRIPSIYVTKAESLPPAILLLPVTTNSTVSDVALGIIKDEMFITSKSSCGITCNCHLSCSTVQNTLYGTEYDAAESANYLSHILTKQLPMGCMTFVP